MHPRQESILPGFFLGGKNPVSRMPLVASPLLRAVVSHPLRTQQTANFRSNWNAREYNPLTLLNAATELDLRLTTNEWLHRRRTSYV